MSANRRRLRALRSLFSLETSIPARSPGKRRSLRRGSMSGSVLRNWRPGSRKWTVCEPPGLITACSCRSARYCDRSNR